MIFGIGIDIQNINRTKKILQKYDSLMIDEIFTKKEWKKIQNNSHPERIAASLFSLKEACSKSLGTGFVEFKFCDIEIVNFPQNIFFKIRNCKENLNNKKIRCSFSIEKESVQSIVITEVI